VRQKAHAPSLGSGNCIAAACDCRTQIAAERARSTNCRRTCHGQYTHSTVASMIKGAVGVLYPNMSKMMTFEARY
jgi:hypothetical protein